MTPTESSKFPKHYASKFYAYRQPNQPIPSGVNTRVDLNTIWFDTLNEFDEAVNYQFVPLEAGYYYVMGQIRFVMLPVGTFTRVEIRFTGANYSTDHRLHDGVNPFPQQANTLLYMTPADRVELYAFQNSGVNQNLIQGIGVTFLTGFRVG